MKDENKYSAKDKYIASMETCHPRLSKMTWLVKCPDNPDGIDGDKLMRMSDDEIFVAYEKWSEKNKK
tara:strand:- start:124 stop:324 length:201 start_codon:yes stop_codon:yes gene_type:complete